MDPVRCTYAKITKRVVDGTKKVYQVEGNINKTIVSIWQYPAYVFQVYAFLFRLHAMLDNLHHYIFGCILSQKLFSFFYLVIAQKI